MNSSVGANSGPTLPRVAHYPSYTFSAAGEIIDLMAALNRPLDPWQAWILRNGLGEVQGPSGPEWAASQCGCWVPRQNGKGDILLALEVGWLWLFGVPLVIHSAHEYKTAQEAFLRIKALAEANEDILGQYVRRVWQAAGEQGVELTQAAKGARLRFMARTRGAGRGFSAPRLVLDEAQELTEELMQAILFVMSAQANPQIWFAGTPPKDPAAWIYNLKESGEAGDPHVAWFDYGIETLDLSDRASQAILRDPATHAATNPSLGLVRGNGTGLRQAAVDNELRLMGAGQAFAMERCGMWLPRARDENDHAIDPQIWSARSALAIPLHQLGDFAVAFHVNARRNHATVTYAGMWKGKWRVGVIAHRPGTAWLLGKLREIKVLYRPVAFTVDARSETTVDELAEIGIRLPEDAEEPKRSELILPTATDVATAFGMIVDGANNEMLEHEDQAPLNSAVSVPPRPLSGGSTFDHRVGVEVGPAVGVGLAMWAYRERIEKIKDDYDPLANIW